MRALLRTADGQFWAAMQEGGLWRAPDDQGRFEPVSKDWPEQRIRVLAAAAAGGAWAGLGSGIRRVRSDGRADDPLRREDGSAFDEIVWSVVEDDVSRLWVGTPFGLWWRPADAETLRPVVPLRSAGQAGELVVGQTGVLGLKQGPDGQLWMLARDGLYRMDLSERGLRLDLALDARLVEQGLGDQLVVDHAGIVWTGRVRFDPQRERWQALGPADGLDVANQVWGASRLLPDGRLVLGTSTGLTLLDPARFRPWDFAPRVVLGAIHADETLLPRGRDGLRIPARTRRLAIGFAGLDYSDPMAVRYRYRLEGQIGHWISGDASQRTATFDNLWPGDYVLVVEATNRVGDWSPYPLVLPFRMEAAFWQTPAFLFAGVALLLFGLFALLRWREAMSARRAHELRSLVELRTIELVHARDAAEAAFSELRGAQGKLVEAEKMASLGQMVAGVAHELNTPLGNALVVSSTLQERAAGIARAVDEGQLRRSELDEFLRVLSEGSQLLVRSVARAHELVSSFKQVAVDRSSSKRRRFDLAAVVREALEMEGPSLRNARFRVEMQIPTGISMDSYPGAIGQIVGNMVNNATLHAFDEQASGTLRIDARLQEGTAGSEVLLSFVDDGKGMDEVTRRKIFEPFFTTKMGRGGTGLGLNIVYNLVSQLLSGSIEVKSNPGGGTRFDLVLPLVAPASDPAA